MTEFLYSCISCKSETKVKLKDEDENENEANFHLHPYLQPDRQTLSV